jgi:hypothetical protein
MADGPDPLGKRALFWMPVGAEAEIDDVDIDDVSGARRRTEPSRSRDEVRHARPAGKHALFSDAAPVDEPEPDRATVDTDGPVPRRGVLSVACSTCGSVTRVGLVEFVALHFPVGAWVPMRTFDRWMTCPSCRRRTWTSVTLAR